MEYNETYIKLAKQIGASHNIYKELFWLIDSYVLDFFTDNHWDKLPTSWKKFFNNMQPEKLASILDLSNNLRMEKVAPLSLLTLRILLKEYSFPRRNFYFCSDASKHKEDLPDIEVNSLLHEDLHKDTKTLSLFWKHVKPKKRHEINIMAKETFKKAVECKCSYIIDVGSGLGHLARMLAYGYNLNVCGIEVQERLTKAAMQLDEHFEVAAVKHYKDESILKKRPIHINLKIQADMDSEEFEQLIKGAFGILDDQFCFGIVGLHPCGDLGSTLLKLFTNCSCCKFINIVGCCFMKLSTYEQKKEACGFPMSAYCREKKLELSYNSREIACHHLEMYMERLQSGFHWELKIHAYRAMIEKLISRNWPNMVHSPLSNLKYTQDLTFSNYCKKALSKYNISIDDNQINCPETQSNLKEWLKVVVYYTLRLQLAPLLETIILLDRLLYIQENGKMFYIKSAFDARISPRNFIVNATKI